MLNRLLNSAVSRTMLMAVVATVAITGTDARASSMTVPTERPGLGGRSAAAITTDTRANAGSSCLAKLAAFTDAKRVRSPRGRFRACRVKGAVQLSTVETPTGPVTLSGKPVLACTFALSLAQWTRDVAAPAARRTVRKRLTALRTGPGFTCRRRNNSRRGKLSEHGLGNAVDITGFRFDATGKRGGFDVKRRLPRRFKRFQKLVRAEACGPFTTILGPGSDRHHSDHLHFDHGRLFRNGKRRAKPPLVCR